MKTFCDCIPDMGPILACTLEHREATPPVVYNPPVWQKGAAKLLALNYTGALTVTLYRQHPTGERPPLATQFEFYTKACLGQWTLEALRTVVKRAKPTREDAAVIMVGAADSEAVTAQRSRMIALEVQACEVAQCITDAFEAVSLDDTPTAAPVMVAPESVELPPLHPIATKADLFALVFPHYFRAKGVVFPDKTADAFINKVLCVPYDIGIVPDLLCKPNHVSRHVWQAVTGWPIGSIRADVQYYYRDWVLAGRPVVGGKRCEVIYEPDVAPQVETSAQVAIAAPTVAIADAFCGGAFADAGDPAPDRVCTVKGTPVVAAPVVVPVSDCAPVPSVHPGQLAHALEVGAWIRDYARKRPGFTMEPSTKRVKTRLEVLAAAGYLALDWQGDRVAVSLARDW